MSLPVWMPGPIFILGYLYDVTSCLAAWFHIPSVGGGVSVWEWGSLSREGLCRDLHRIRKVGGTHPSVMHSCPVTGSVIEEKFDMQTDCKIIFCKHLYNFHPQSKCFWQNSYDMISKIFWTLDAFSWVENWTKLQTRINAKCKRAFITNVTYLLQKWSHKRSLQLYKTSWPVHRVPPIVKPDRRISLLSLAKLPYLSLAKLQCLDTRDMSMNQRERRNKRWIN